MVGQAEYAVIGAVLLDPKLSAQMRSRLKAEDFESTEGREFYEYISEGNEIDPVLLESKLGHTVFYAECIKITPTTSNFSAYLDIMVEQSRKRKLQRIALDLNNQSFGEQSTDEILSELSASVDDLKSKKHTDVKSSADIEIEWVQHYENAKKNPEAGWCKSGYWFLDTMLGNGFIDSGLYIIGARPGMGKTTFALNIAEKIAKANKPILFVSLEMSAKQIMAKRISISSYVPYCGLLNGSLNDDDEQKAAMSAVELAKKPFFMLENASATVADIETAARQIDGIKCIMVDYLGLVRSQHADKKLYEQVTEVSRDLKTLAMRLDIPVIALCQLNRENAKTQSKIPNLTDLRDSGAIEQDADGVLLLYREDYFEKEPTDKPKLIEVIIAKNRHGSSNCTIKYGWRAECGAITETDGEKAPWEVNNE